MNWATLAEGCPQIVERIVHHAVNREGALAGPNKRLIQYQKYCQVCSQWKVVLIREILSSRSRFALQWNTFQTEEIRIIKHFIRQGFLRLVNELTVESISCHDLNFLCNADGNQIEEFCFPEFIWRMSNDDWLMDMERLLNTSKNAHVFSFQLGVCHQQQAESVWKLLCWAVHCNARPKTINYNVQDWTGNIINWDSTVASFQSRITTHGGVGSIKLIRVFMHDKVLFPSNFARLGDIDTISFVYRSYVHLDAYNFQMSQITAKCLRIELHVPNNQERLTWRDILELTRVKAIYWRSPSTQTLEFTVILLGHTNGIFTANFKCDTSPWEQVREWLTNIKVKSWTKE